MDLFFSALWIAQTLAALLAARGLVSGLRFRRLLVEAPCAPPLGEVALPPAMVIAPMKAGDDLSVERHLSNLLAQSYPGLRLRFVVESESDPAWQPLSLAAQANPQRVEVIIAGLAADCGQKAHNLRAATRDIPAEVAMLAFVDADVEVEPDWLRSLVAPLAGNEPPTATTGFRYFVTDRLTLAGLWATAWNGQVLMLYGRSQAPFLWGGSWAIRTDELRNLGIRDAWIGRLSTDFAATAAILGGGGCIRFLPRCIGRSEPPRTRSAAWEFVVRQLVIVARNHRSLFRIAYIRSMLHAVGLWGGAAGALAAVALGRGWWATALLATGVFILACELTKIMLRTRGVESILPAHRRTIALGGTLAAWGHLLFHVISLMAMTRAAWTHHVRWRDVIYSLGKGGEVEALQRDPKGA